jgi:hypothetical protein
MILENVLVEIDSNTSNTIKKSTKKGTDIKEKKVTKGTGKKLDADTVKQMKIDQMMNITESNDDNDKIGINNDNKDENYSVDNEDNYEGSNIISNNFRNDDKNDENNDNENNDDDNNDNKKENHGRHLNDLNEIQRKSIESDYIFENEQRNENRVNRDNDSNNDNNINDNDTYNNNENNDAQEGMISASLERNLDNLGKIPIILKDNKSLGDHPDTGEPQPTNTREGVASEGAAKRSEYIFGVQS